MSLSLYRVPDGQQSKGQSNLPCPSVYSPATALRSLSSVALSSAPATGTLSLLSTEAAIHPHFSPTLSSTFLHEATNLISSTFLHEATGTQNSITIFMLDNKAPNNQFNNFGPSPNKLSLRSQYRKRFKSRRRVCERICEAFSLGTTTFHSL